MKENWQKIPLNFPQWFFFFKFHDRFLEIFTSERISFLVSTTRMWNGTQCVFAFWFDAMLILFYSIVILQFSVIRNNSWMFSHILHEKNMHFFSVFCFILSSIFLFLFDFFHSFFEIDVCTREADTQSLFDTVRNISRPIKINLTI